MEQVEQVVWSRSSGAGGAGQVIWSRWSRSSGAGGAGHLEQVEQGRSPGADGAGHLEQVEQVIWTGAGGAVHLEQVEQVIWSRWSGARHLEAGTPGASQLVVLPRPGHLTTLILINIMNHPHPKYTDGTKIMCRRPACLTKLVLYILHSYVM